MPALPPAPFEILTADEPGDVRRVRVAGELDLSTTPELRAELRRCARAAREVVLDLTNVTFIDSSGLSMIVGVDAESRADGFGFAVVPSPPVARIIELCGLTGHLPVRAYSSAPGTPSSEKIS